MRLVQFSYKGSNLGLGKKRTLLEVEPEIIVQEPVPNGVEYYLALPDGSALARAYKLEVRAQWNAVLESGNKCRNLVFPAPELADDTIYNADTYSTPDFNATDQLFWADQITNNATSG